MNTYTFHNDLEVECIFITISPLKSTQTPSTIHLEIKNTKNETPN